MTNYPCRDCIVAMLCQKICGFLTYGDGLMDFFLTNKHCPDCRSNYVDVPSYWGISVTSGSIICTECKSIFYIDLREGAIWRYSKCPTESMSYNWRDHKNKSTPDFVNFVLKPLLERHCRVPR
jgi:hypothetical protein